MTRKRYSELTGAMRMRMVTMSLLRSAAVITVLVVLYYTAPLEQGLDPGTWIGFGFGLVFGLLVFAGVIGWQVRAIIRSDFPRLQAIQAVSTGLPLLLLLYASTYIVIAHNQPDSFSEALSRTDALYFTVIIFATVGFGDIVPRSELAQAVVMTQMLVGLIAVGLVLRLLLVAVQVAVRRHEPEAPEQPDAIRLDGA
jgi:voltage-gated potassium channel